ncbi:MAG: hypothetical protein HY288_05295 [Planctomycetia bacterium]|nr:hypothetical protein [Planctomycetia bacterium]
MTDPTTGLKPAAAADRDERGFGPHHKRLASGSQRLREDGTDAYVIGRVTTGSASCRLRIMQRAAGRS